MARFASKHFFNESLFSIPTMATSGIVFITSFLDECHTFLTVLSSSDRFSPPNLSSTILPEGYNSNANVRQLLPCLNLFNSSSSILPYMPYRIAFKILTMKVRSSTSCTPLFFLSRLCHTLSFNIDLFIFPCTCCVPRLRLFFMWSLTLRMSFPSFVTSG